MKKIVCLVLALICLASFAMAENVPSKSTADMVTVTVKAENIPADAGFVVAPVVDAVEHKEQVEACQKEIAKLVASTTVEEYFGEVKTSTGEVVDLKEVLGAETLNVHEFMPVIAENYETSYGKVTATFQFSTPYAKDEPVIVLIGTPDPASLTGEMVWVAIEGIGAEEGIQVEFDEATLETIQGGNAMMAVVSK